VNKSLAGQIILKKKKFLFVVHERDTCGVLLTTIPNILEISVRKLTDSNFLEILVGNFGVHFGEFMFVIVLKRNGMSVRCRRNKQKSSSFERCFHVWLEI